jgi:hypothetical protein
MDLYTQRDHIIFSHDVKHVSVVAGTVGKYGVAVFLLKFKIQIPKYSNLHLLI